VFTVEGAVRAVHFDDLHETDEEVWKYIDDVTGETLDAEHVAKARAEEINTFDEMGVYVYVSREAATRDKSGKLIGARWADVLRELKSSQYVGGPRICE